MFGNLLLVDVDLQLKSSKQKENVIQNPIIRISDSVNQRISE